MTEVTRVSYEHSTEAELDELMKPMVAQGWTPWSRERWGGQAAMRDWDIVTPRGGTNVYFTRSDQPAPMNTTGPG